MKKKILFDNKIAKGLVSLIEIVILLSAILASTFVYQNNITADVVKDTSIDYTPAVISIKKVNDVNELNQLNEGWYKVKNGYVYYLDTFNSYVPLYIRVNNLEQQNGLFVVDADGTVSFDGSFDGLTEKEVSSTSVPKTFGELKVGGSINGNKILNIEKEDGTDVLIITVKQPDGTISKMTGWRESDDIQTEGVKVTQTTFSDRVYSAQSIRNGENFDIVQVDGKYYYREKTGFYYGADFNSADNSFRLKKEDGDYIVERNGALVKVDASGNTELISGPVKQEKTKSAPNEVITNNYRPTIDAYINSFRGNPKDWALDDNGNFVCTNLEGCRLYQDDLGKTKTLSYQEGETFPPPGGDPEKENINKNRAALEQLKKETEKKEFQQKSRAFFTEVERIFTEYQGLGYYSTLFFSDNELLKWRDSVDQIFSTLYLGTEYWSSEICGQYLDGQNEGIAYAETPQGLAQVGAHIEATRTQEIKTNNATVFIYKITFAVRNGDFDKDPRAPEEMNINVLIKGQQTVKIFKKDQTVKRGTIFSKTGKNAIVKESSNIFNQVCITFDEIPLRWKLNDKQLCNKIQESAGTPTTIETPPTSGTTTNNPQDEINDF